MTYITNRRSLPCRADTVQEATRLVSAEPVSADLLALPVSMLLRRRMWL
jgi:hypothetical protein